MNRVIIGILGIFLAGMLFSSCQKCMTCTILYTLPNGEERTDISPQVCGSSGDLDDKESQLEEAYSTYRDVEINCDRQ